MVLFQVASQFNLLEMLGPEVTQRIVDILMTKHKVLPVHWQRASNGFEIISLQWKVALDNQGRGKSIA